MEDEFNPEEAINIRAMASEKPKQRTQTVDRIVSDIVGKEILTTNPKLISLIVKWKKEKGDDESPDNFFTDEAKIAELKATL